jgi:hypothetical protein
MNGMTDNSSHSISIGISGTDGVLHLGLDQHDNSLHYRASAAGLATQPTAHPWSPALFPTPVLDHLPGPAASLDKSVHYVNVTYPRFVSVPKGSGGVDLIMEFRVGRSGLGDDWLYEYVAGQGWSLVGKYLEGVNSEHPDLFLVAAAPNVDPH